MPFDDATRASKNPLMIYDGNCGFCKYWINRWRFLTRGKVNYVPYQEVANQYPDVPLQRFQEAVQLVDSDGRIYQGAEAVYRSLAQAGKGRFLLWLYQRAGWFRNLSEFLYRMVADHRVGFSRITYLLWGKDPVPPTYFLSRSFFLKALAFIYLAAFLSFWVQAEGLLGSKGILPFQPLLELLGPRLGWKRFWLFPTLAWFYPHPVVLHLICGSGVVLSVLLFAGICPVVSSALLWAAYVSLVTMGRDFMGFQWDALLLEAGFLAIFLSSPGWTLRSEKKWKPSRAVIFLFQWLLFRLMFSSGMVKLLSGDPSWKNLTALTYHYQTQPLPAWTAWYFHHLPLWFHKLSAGGMFFAELILPFFIFLPRPFRIVSAVGLIGLQLLIMATGNYCFFNLLSIALCLFLFEDSLWPKSWRPDLDPVKPPASWSRWILLPVTLFVLLMTTVSFSRTLRLPIRWPETVKTWHKSVAPFRSFNSYGLFAVMTKTRPELIVEGSRDGISWKPYEFKYKPGDLNKKPRFNMPHQPRLDWQMWFAALSSPRNNPWLLSFCLRLLEGSKPVLDLLKKNPFPDHPPEYIRIRTYDYQFTSPEERKKTGAWWKRGQPRIYLPALSLKALLGAH